jgi:hypothetical protein
MEINRYLNPMLLKPSEWADDQASKLGEENTFCQTLPTRLFFLLQVIASVAAIPILLIGALLESFLNLFCSTDGEPNPFLNMGKRWIEHIGISLPTSFLGAFTSIPLARNVGDKLFKCFEPILR